MNPVARSTEATHRSPPVTNGGNRVTILADCGSAEGVGHVMRCLALTEALERRGDKVEWITDPAAIGWLSEIFASRSYRHQPIPPSSREIRSLVSAHGSSIVIVDSYQDQSELALELAGRGVRVVSLVDDATPRLVSDLYVCPGVRAPWLDDAESPVLAGPEFVLMRDEVRSLRPTEWERYYDNRPLALALRLGGTDGAGIAATLISILSAVPTGPSVEVSPDTSDARAAIAALPPTVRERFSLTPAGSEAFSRAADSDCVITAAGVSAWEFACAGVPQILIEAADNQGPNIEYFSRMGWAPVLGNTRALVADPQAAAIRLEQLLEAREGLLIGAQAAWTGVDGNGADRAAGAISELVAAG